jgi:hypothetical protein
MPHAFTQVQASEFMLSACFLPEFPSSHLPAGQREAADG